MRPRRRENVAPTPPKQEQENSDMSTDDMLDSINLDFDNNVSSFDDSSEGLDNNDAPRVQEEIPHRQERQERHEPREERQQQQPQRLRDP